MMNYEIFKEVVKEKFMDYMPDSFKGMELIVRPAEKVNMTYDAINIRGEDTTISPHRLRRLLISAIASENGLVLPVAISSIPSLIWL